jgi:hypothetical protein
MTGIYDQQEVKTRNIETKEEREEESVKERYRGKKQPKKKR